VDPDLDRQGNGAPAGAVAQPPGTGPRAAADAGLPQDQTVEHCRRPSPDARAHHSPRTAVISSPGRSSEREKWADVSDPGRTLAATDPHTLVRDPTASGPPAERSARGHPPAGAAHLGDVDGQLGVGDLLERRPPHAHRPMMNGPGARGKVRADGGPSTQSRALACARWNP